MQSVAKYNSLLRLSTLSTAKKLTGASCASSNIYLIFHLLISLKFPSHSHKMILLSADTLISNVFVIHLTELTLSVCPFKVNKT